MFSADSGRGELARLLLDSGADPLLVNMDGQTAADIAAVGERETLEDIIMSFTGERGRQVKSRVRLDIREVTEMERTLSNAGLQHLNVHFGKHNIDPETSMLLREDDIKSLGVEEIGDVKKLLKCQAELHKEEWKRSSLPSLTSEQMSEGLMIDIVTATTMMANISMHARYMRRNVEFIKQQLGDHGERLLNTGSDLVSQAQLELQLGAASDHITHLGREVNSLARELGNNHATAKGGWLLFTSLNHVIFLVIFEKQHFK